MKSKSSGNVTNADQEKLKDLTFINRSELNSSHVRLEELEQIAVIGKGHRSIVKLVHWNAQNDLGGCFALKTIPLHSLRTADAMDKLKTERDILAFMTKTIKSPWVIQLCNTFYDQNGFRSFSINDTLNMIGPNYETGYKEIDTTKVPHSGKYAEWFTK